MRDSDRAHQQARDMALVARIHQGDSAALTELIDVYGLQLAAVAATLVGSDDVAEDVVQDVFISLWDRRNTLTISENVGGYLYRAVRNRSANVIRHEQTHRRILDQFATWDVDSVPVVQNLADLALEYESVEAVLGTMLEQIPPQQRKAFLLHWDAQLTYAEIAEVMGITVPSVHKLMYRATQRLAGLIPGRRLEEEP